MSVEEGRLKRRGNGRRSPTNSQQTASCFYYLYLRKYMPSSFIINLIFIKHKTAHQPNVNPLVGLLWFPAGSACTLFVYSVVATYQVVVHM